jgi:serine/threonine protein kinase
MSQTNPCWKSLIDSVADLGDFEDSPGKPSSLPIPSNPTISNSEVTAVRFTQTNARFLRLRVFFSKDGCGLLRVLRDIAIAVQSPEGMLPIHFWNVADLGGSSPHADVIAPLHAGDPTELKDQDRRYILIDVGRALQFLHACGVPHGNIGPHSIFVKVERQTWGASYRGLLGQLGSSREDSTIEDDTRDFLSLCCDYLKVIPAQLEQLRASAKDKPASLADIVKVLFGRSRFFRPIDGLHRAALIKAKLESFARLESSVAGLPIQEQCLRALTFFHTYDAKPPCAALPFCVAAFTRRGWLWSGSWISGKGINVDTSLLPDPSPAPFIDLLLPQTHYSCDGPTIGHGAFGSVARGTDGGGRDSLAVKFGHPRWVHDSMEDSPIVLSDDALNVLVVAFVREVLTAAYCRHPAVLPVFGWNIRPRDRDRELVLVTPFERRGTVLDNLETMTNVQRLIVAYGVARGMSHLHSLHVVHRDLKPDNVLLDENWMPMISDLGWAKVVMDDSQSGRRGTTKYMAPEVWSGQTQYPVKVDVYSYSIFLWELIARQEWRPAGSGSDRPSLQRIRDLKYVLPIDHQFLARCWNPKPGLRPTFDDIVRELELAGRRCPAEDQRAFNEYKAFVDAEAKFNVVDRDLWLLMLKTPQLTGVYRSALPAQTPLSEVFVRVFSEMVDPELGPRVATVLRYIFMTKGGLDTLLYHYHMDLFTMWPPGRRHFPLAEFLVNPTEEFAAEWEITKVDVTNSPSAFLRALRNVFAFICGAHPAVLPLRGWNIERDSGKTHFVMVTAKCCEFDLCVDGEEDFAHRIMSGMAHLHSLGIAHGNFSRGSLCLDCDSKPRIRGFGIVKDDAFQADVVGCRDVFSEVFNPMPSFLVNWAESPYAFDHAVMNLFREPFGAGAPLPGFHLDLLLTLSADSGFWQKNASRPLDVSAVLAGTAHGLSEESRQQFAGVIQGLLDTVGYLRLDEIDEFEASLR